jgi:hypothetical protein
MSCKGHAQLSLLWTNPSPMYWRHTTLLYEQRSGGSEQVCQHNLVNSPLPPTYLLPRTNTTPPKQQVDAKKASRSDMDTVDWGESSKSELNQSSPTIRPSSEARGKPRANNDRQVEVCQQENSSGNSNRILTNS